MSQLHSPQGNLNRRGTSFSRVAHSGRHGLPHALLEGRIEGAVVSETAFVGQLLDGERTLGGDSFMVEIDEVADAQAVDVGIVGQSLLGEMLAEVNMPVLVGSSSTQSSPHNTT